MHGDSHIKPGCRVYYRRGADEQPRQSVITKAVGDAPDAPYVHTVVLENGEALTLNTFSEHGHFLVIQAHPDQDAGILGTLLNAQPQFIKQRLVLAVGDPYQDELTLADTTTGDCLYLEEKSTQTSLLVSADGESLFSGKPEQTECTIYFRVGGLNLNVPEGMLEQVCYWS